MSTARLVISPYLQKWDGASSLTVRVLLIPRGSPIDSLTGTSPSFAEANFSFDCFVASPAAVPSPGGSPVATVSSPAVPTALATFKALANQYQIDPNPTESGIPPVNSQVRKQLPRSYQQAVGYAPGRTALVSTDQSYACAFKHPPSTYTPLPTPNPKLPWGRVLAFLLRNSALAEAAGLARELQISLDPKSVKNGAFIWLSLSSDSDAAALVPNGLLIHAARIPPLSTARGLFTPVLFPVVDNPPGIDYGEVFAEVEDYNDGFAKAVHCAQPQQLDPLAEKPDGTRPTKELGIRIGWDDEQVTIWMNRQLTAPTDSPLGVRGYRIDTRLTGTAPWTSLVQASGPYGVQNLPLGIFNGELALETHPIQFQAQDSGVFWLPLYFASWSGPSLVTLDNARMQLAGGTPAPAGKVSGVPPAVSLVYGQSYDFRVRLADHTGGGPGPTSTPRVPGPSPIGKIPFRRWIRPLPATMNEKVPIPPDPTSPPASISFKRPLLSYPSVVCTGAYPNAISQLLSDLPVAQAEGREPGLPDPDGDRLQITIEARGLAQDPEATDGPYVPIVTTTRAFPSDPAASIELQFAWQDIADVSKLKQAANGPINLPTARDICLSIVALCKSDPQAKYFGSDDVRYGPEVSVKVRKHSMLETNLFASDLPSNRFSAYFFQPDVQFNASTMFAQRASGVGNTAPSDLASRMAAELGLRNSGFTLQSQPGRRVVFGCSSKINHTLSPDFSSITFGSQSDIALHWLVMIRLILNRDWTWDGLAQNGIAVTRNGTYVGTIALSDNVNSSALESPQRNQTDLIFFDAINPKPPKGKFPQELTPQYAVTPHLNGTPKVDAPIRLSMTLPVTSPPQQTPEIASAGLAMSSYARSADYSKTERRRKMLWLEFSEPPDDPRDRFFARVLRNVPDPILSTTSTNVPVTADPPLPIDPEAVRKIVQGQADDRAGLDAMQQLVPSESPLHWGMPLPPGLELTSPELFGFFTYEIRVGHYGEGHKDFWSTAQGRYGPPLQVTGVQHPAPPLTMTLQRTQNGVAVSVPFALPVLDGVSVQPSISYTSIWILLYAQAEQVDGKDRRNVLLTRTQAVSRPQRQPRYASLYGEALLDSKSIGGLLALLGFASSAPLSVLAVELLPQTDAPDDPLGSDLGSQRILRTSELVPVPAIC